MKPTIPINFTTTNFLIVMTGTILMAVGLYRIYPLQINRQFTIMNGPLALMAAIGLGLLFWKRNPDSFFKWGVNSAIFAGKFLPLMVLLVLVMTLGGVLTGLHEKHIQKFLLDHHLVGPFLASLVTPTSNALVPVVESAWKTKALQPMCLYYLQASVLMSVPLFMLRQVGFTEDTGIPVKMYVMGCIVAVIMLFVMKPMYWLTEAVCDFAGTAWSGIVVYIRTALY